MKDKLVSGTESKFEFEELFFSRTNTRGVIQSGNSVFQRVSQFDWDELLNKPHSVIRHPAMPRAVFHLLWEVILNGQSICAYVVNQSKQGQYYWVLAIVTPIEGGFLSVRLKPSSPIFQIVKAKYAEVLEIEKSKKISPKESQEILLNEIKKLNFRDYRHFMTEALTQELTSRQKEMGVRPPRVLSQLNETLKLSAELQVKCQQIFASYRQNAFAPLNLEVQAARIGDQAASIAVVSSQYSRIAKQIQDAAKNFLAASNLVQEKITACQFDISNSILQNEMSGFFKKETRETPIDKNIEMKLLEEQGRQGLANAQKSLKEIDLEFSRFKTAFDEVRMLATALDIVSVTGKIEAAKIGDAAGELNHLLTALAAFKVSLKGTLDEIETIMGKVVGLTGEMRQELEESA